VKSEFKYEPVKSATKQEIAERLLDDDPDVVAEALYSAVRYVEGWRWVQDECLRRLKSPKAKIRWAAATCLGDLVHFGGPLDFDSVIPALEQAIQDPSIADPAGFRLSVIKQSRELQ
jgi:hypothetical protein